VQIAACRLERLTISDLDTCSLCAAAREESVHVRSTLPSECLPCLVIIFVVRCRLVYLTINSSTSCSGNSFSDLQFSCSCLSGFYLLLCVLFCGRQVAEREGMSGCVRLGTSNTYQESSSKMRWLVVGLRFCSEPNLEFISVRFSRKDYL